MIQHDYTSRYLVVIDGDVYVYKYEKGEFDQPKHIFIGKPKVFEMTEL